MRYAAPQAADVALDIGTGTGLVAHLLEPHVRHVTGVDFAWSMLCAARRAQNHQPGVAFVCADIARLPYPRRHFNLIVASFGLNATDPYHSLRALRRCLAPGGRLVIQEWGPATALDLAIDELAGDLLHVDAPDSPPLWDDYLQDPDDYQTWLADLGLVVEDAAECAPVTVRVPTPEVFLAYKLAWEPRRAALEAADRAAFLAEVHARLTALAAPDGALHWQPVLLRARAQLQEI